ncbi:hypothetical protein TTHERM_00476730 (macronuclear) [Tetrahymena thermophila SB210]|uniref:Uncharacterized protein n=1 Tax=Tetrahymena thermophila (strain SB210) TaxID=312017 RepID=I7MJS1_TETTS|nr:hypothetical protein TTHERM_00476730 [Tetrahymena thermophila SB210]EAR97135.2 hypothetical protein TTHERM_00476730 [Tetrahymena thermophila SB210]|eukprot:XP_001017380.2 hypothetical protein TTHERM_00476730 [Tetrahymena thermophila SB210]
MNCQVNDYFIFLNIDSIQQSLKIIVLCNTQPKLKKKIIKKTKKFDNKIQNKQIEQKMEKQQSQISQKVSQILNNDEKCFVCKGLEEPSIVIFSSLPKEKNFVQLICSQCLKAQQNKQIDSLNETTGTDQNNENKIDLVLKHQQNDQGECKESQSQQSLELFNSCLNEKNQSLRSELQNQSSIKNDKQEQKLLSQISENSSQAISQLFTCDCSLIDKKDLFTFQIKEESIQNHSLLSQNQSSSQNNEELKIQSKVSQDQAENNEEKKILEQKNLEKSEFIESKPAFLIQPYHVQISFDQLISQFESSLKFQKLQLLQKSTELQQFIKSSLRVIYDIQQEVENMHSRINEVSSQPESLIYQLKETNFSQDRQSLLEQLIEYVDLNQKSVEAKLKQFKFQEKIDDIQTKLEYLSESLQPNLFELNSQIYKVKKETVDHCNYLLSKLNIKGKWKQYSDIQMDEEIMHPGMRGVYRFRISQDGRVSRGTNTGYVYLAYTTTEEYARYDFCNLKQQNQGWFPGSSSSQDPIAEQLASYFLEQREKILNLQRKISNFIDS